MGAAAAEALNKWDGGRARLGEVGLPPPQFWGPGVEICKDMVHFGVKNKHFI